MNKNKLRDLNPNFEDELGQNWTREMVINLRYYAYDSFKLSWMTDQEAKHLSSLNNKITFWAAILSSVSAIFLAGLLALVELEDYRWLFYLIGISNIIIAVFVATFNNYQLIYNLSYKVNEFSEKSDKYGKLYRRIRNQFHLPKDERYNCKTLMEYTTDRFDELNRETLFIRGDTIKKWDETKIVKNDLGEMVYDDIIRLPVELREYNKNRNKIEKVVVDVEENSNSIEV